MSYHRRGMGGLADGDTYPAGTQVVAGFQVIGLPSDRAELAKLKLRDAVSTSFPFGAAAPVTPGTRDSVNWGPAYGVPSGRLYALITTNRDGVTGAAINQAWISVARDLGRRMGLTVNLTNAHTLGGASPLPPLTPDVGPDGMPAPVDPGGTMSPLLVAGVVTAAIGVPLVALIAMGGRRRRLARLDRR
jgi:hypothetical protein